MMGIVSRSKRNQVKSLLPHTHKVKSRMCLPGMRRLADLIYFRYVWELV